MWPREAFVYHADMTWLLCDWRCRRVRYRDSPAYVLLEYQRSGQTNRSNRLDATGLHSNEQDRQITMFRSRHT